MILTWRPRRRRSLLTLSSIGLITLTSLLITLLAACGVSSSTSDPSQTMPTVSMLDNIFTPKELHIKVGETVLWVNHGQTIHTVTADDNSFDSGNMNTGAQYRHIGPLRSLAECCHLGHRATQPDEEWRTHRLDGCHLPHPHTWPTGILLIR